MSRRLIGAVSIALFSSVVIFGVVYARLVQPRSLQQAATAPLYAQLAVGNVAPQFVLPTTHGVVDLNAENRPVFIEIFATWCQGCQRETNIVNALYRSFGSRVAFVAIPGSDTGTDGTSPETQVDVLNFQLANGVQYPIAAYDPQLVTAQQYMQANLPTFAIVDREKKIAYINSGEVSQRDLTTALKAVLR